MIDRTKAMDSLIAQDADLIDVASGVAQHRGDREVKIEVDVTVSEEFVREWVDKRLETLELGLFEDHIAADDFKETRKDIAALKRIRDFVIECT